MLHYDTISPGTLELLRKIQSLKMVSLLRESRILQLFTTLKSLTYFDDAEKDPMPMMMSPLKWEDVKMQIVAEVGNFLSR